MSIVNKRTLLFILVSYLFLLSCNNRNIKKVYYPNGTLKEEDAIFDGKPNGLTKIYYPDGKLWIEALYKDGVQEGLTKIYFENGNLQKTVNLHHGTVEDTQKLFYPNRNIQEIAYIIDGEKYGNIEMFYSNGKLKYQGKLIDGYQDSCWETYDSITGRITNITMYKTDTIQKIFGKKLGSIDSTELTIKSINNNELPFSIHFPVDWKLLYPGNNTLITAFSTISPKSEILTGMTITKYPLKGATFSQFMDGNIKGLMENHQIVESLSRKKLVIDGKNAEEIAYYGYVGKEPGGLIITSILLGTDSYTINCYAPKKDFPLYINLFREIINTIKFKQG